MTNILHIHFNRDFESYLKSVHHDTYKAIMDQVAETAAQIIKNYSIINRCPTKIDDEIRVRIPSDNLFIFAVLKNYVLVFIDHRTF